MLMKNDKQAIKPISKEEKKIAEKAAKLIVRDYGEVIKRFANT